MDFQISTVYPDRAAEVRKFCLDQIAIEYGYDYNPEWHKDLDSLIEPDGMYSEASKGIFVIAHTESEILGSCGARDLKFKPSNHQLCIEKLGTKNYASLWRTYVDSAYRNMGIATTLLQHVNSYLTEANYEAIYLHTSHNKPDSLKFWQNKGYKIFHEEDTPDRTVHMVKLF